MVLRIGDLIHPRYVISGTNVSVGRSWSTRASLYGAGEAGAGVACCCGCWRVGGLAGVALLQWC